MGIVSDSDGVGPVTARGLPRPLVLFLATVLVLWGLSLLDGLLFRGPGGEAFGRLVLIHPGFDLLCYVERFPFLHTERFFTYPEFPWNYPAPCVFLYRFFYLFETRGHVASAILTGYAGILAVLLVGAGTWFARALRARALTTGWTALFVAGSVLLSWPIYFALERGNIEAVLWLGLGLAILAYVRKRWMLAAILLGVIAAFKLYPLLCFALFLPLRRFREIVAGAVAMAVTTLLGLLYLGPTLPIAAQQTAHGIKHFVQTYSAVYDPVVIGYDHSAFSVAKALLAGHQRLIPIVLSRYTLLAGGIALILFFGRTWRMPRPNQVMMLIVVTVLLPSTSFDYTLQSLYIPWAWLSLLIVSAWREGRELPGALPAMLCFGLVFGPETFLHVHGILFAGQIKAVVLLVLLAISLRFRFPEEVRGPHSA